MNHIITCQKSRVGQLAISRYFPSGDFPDKAIRYGNHVSHTALMILDLQKVLWDRRAVLGILEATGVPTPRRLVVSRDGGPSLGRQKQAKLPTKARQHLESLHINQELKIIDQDTIEVNGKRLTKPLSRNQLAVKIITSTSTIHPLLGTGLGGYSAKWPTSLVSLT
ncbi:inositol hexakisphosphate and diphosphoinositol-pentakisphosphate kinase [Entomophthora muscae]|uniref:Inositol hexakisphosphate and diphosphoinositol-pentakisphosphate kinase n=1 Tax=Entomophthora muscae TaxID=34485 RepID=A0ACC2SYX0_9FUNG|nr:inositol hexakisphosphate and diphosphoinositol-pentakisphosphate kinase [Entomophthora muscae]